MGRIATAAQAVFERIKALQAEQMAFVTQLVTKLMPNDFRTSMMIAYQKRSEAKSAEGALKRVTRPNYG